MSRRESATRPALMIGIATTTGWFLLGVLIAATGAWGALALSISGPQPEALRTLLAAAFALASVAVLVAIVLNRRRWRALSAWFVLFLAVLAWWATLRPSNDRDWLPNVARLPWASVDGNIVTVHNIRNFTYRSENDFTPAWYDKSYDLSKLEGIDVIAVYWMGPDIAHVFVSFAFAGGEQLAVSIETRTEKGEGYSTVKGFFRQYELYYVVADERDVIGLRTNYRRDPPEDVYVYRLKSTPQGRQRFFLEYINQINALKDKPEFYNSLTTNCTTNIWMNARVNPSHLPFSWKILASGHVPEFIYENGGLDDAGRPFAELQRRAHVNDRAHGAGITANFSQNIRRTQ